MVFKNPLTNKGLIQYTATSHSVIVLIPMLCIVERKNIGMRGRSLSYLKFV